ncbi:CBS domain-containing protein [Streptomyces chitinivorans]|uniref:CBS domain-containing protein n=1 Tax=Streptomyces chitinivorans TaxID=1257027 RepID=A0ABW7HQA8_9ACTN|nr:CBS domain-containing protein [Streptomyces chitinivorans]MDH2411298.1 CBS domain-containing protein [Streptomyces chitinivorans]
MKHKVVGAVMTIDVVKAHPTTPFKQIAHLLARHGISGLPVVDGDDKVLGVVSETDLLAHQARQGSDDAPPRGRTGRRRAAGRPLTAGELMTSPAVTVHALDSVARAARTMVAHGVQRLPVLDEEERLVGIVTRRDLLGVFLRPDADIRAQVVDEVLIRSLWLSPDTVSVSVAEGVVTLTGQVERRSEIPVATALIRRLDGVVDVVSRLTYRLDDSRLRPEEPALHGLADRWLRNH